MIAQHFTDGARPATDQVPHLVHQAFRRAAEALAQEEAKVLRQTESGKADIPAVRLLRDMDGVTRHHCGERIKLRFSTPGSDYPVAADLEKTSQLVEDLVNGDVIYRGQASSTTMQSAERPDAGGRVERGRLVHLLAMGADRYAHSTQPAVEEGFRIFWTVLSEELAKVPCDAEFVLERNSMVLEHTAMSVTDAVVAVEAARSQTMGRTL